MMHPRKTKIRIPQNTSNDLNFDEVLTLLQDAIDKIFNDDVGVLSFEKLYHAIYTQVRGGQSEKIYKEVKTYVVKKLDKIQTNLFAQHLNNEKKLSDLEMLKTVANMWEKLCYKFKIISDLMIYLDKVYSKENRKLELYDLFLELFKNTILNKMVLEINKILLKTINKVRDLKVGKMPSDTTIDEAECIEIWKIIISMMELIEDGKGNYFLNRSETYLIEETASYYKNIDLSNNLSLKEYLKKVTAFKEIEFTLDTLFLNSDTSTKITSSLDEVLIMDKITYRLPTFVRQCANDNDTKLLQELYSLSSQTKFRLNVINAIKLCLNDDLSACTVDTTIRKRSTIAFKWCSCILEIYQAFEKLLNDIDFDDIDLSENEQTNVNKASVIIRSVFSKYLALESSLKTEMISLYLDTYSKTLRDENGTPSSKKNLDKCIKLLPLLSEKDLFESLYKQYLSKRLLQKTSTLKHEKWMVKKIKEQMGTFFTSKFEGMLRDIQTSEDMLKVYKNNYGDKLFDIEYTPNVLTMTTWPFNHDNSLTDGNTLEENKITLPDKLEEMQDNFEKCYKKKYDQRLLKWSANLSMMVIGYQFEKSYHELALPLYSALIFLLFQENDSLTFDEMSNYTKIPEKELTRHLISLAVAPRNRILKKFPLTKTISGDHQFSINESFTHPSRSVKIHIINATATAINPKPTSSTSSVEESLHRERLQTLNTAVVRVMKAHRKLLFNELLEKSIELMKDRFTVTASMLTKSINNLVSKEYLQRDPDSKDLIYYLP
ncbi:hypothetical protein TPHA_0K01470 [Tetrapisispora phaffii CBS 4417]|uniref:Cullin family profile domain-containing protein n=1 Tax=Tetrapisispora phaffii (strain ATCC 24235 / CBS 4417 / NBRC 1672 / NRRL Y-8282 / UCD 70-5) TaxID=1071381 RepID=G8BZF2_TETPH|nr:hypothetical protein TPHA_0K01470 [Tetrapisispora phaffii CBS 4417]CCE65280.1 hypothetical protein TPHA_0K01470 [Tetrapisispora phaffii CBS 4417]